MIRWYLPHFAAERPEKETTKTQIVFDASAKENGVSLNDVIHCGPKLQSDLCEVLLRLRKNPVALVCDISEMYLQVGLEVKVKAFCGEIWTRIAYLIIMNSKDWCLVSTPALS